MSANGVKAGKAYVEVTAKSDVSKKLDADKKALKDYAMQVAAIGVSIAAIGAAVYGPILYVSKQFADMGSEIADLRATTGIGAEALSGLKYAAEMTGVEFSALQSGLNGMAKFTGKVAAGAKTATGVLKKLGISAQEFLAATPEDRLVLLADGLTKVTDPTLKAATAAQIFGKSGMAMTNMLWDGSKGLNEFLAEAKQLGLLITDDEADAADELGDAWDRVGKVWHAITFQTGAAFAKVLTDILNGVARTGGAVVEFLRNNRELVLGIGATIAVLGGLAIAFLSVVAAGITLKMVMVGLGAIVGALSLAWAFLGTIQTAVAAVNAWLTANLTMEGIAAAFAAIQTWMLNIALAALTGTASAAAAALGLLLSPLGLISMGLLLVVGALIAGTVWFFGFTQVGQQSLASLGEGFYMLWQTATQTVKGIFDAILAGNWGLAGQIAIQGIMVAWYQGIGSLRVAWAGFKSWLLQLFAGIVESIASSFAKIISAIVSRIEQVAGMVGIENVPGAAGARGIAAGINAAGRGAADRLRATGDKMVFSEISDSLSDVAKAQGKLTELTDQASKERAEKFKPFQLPEFKYRPNGGLDTGSFSSAATFNARVAELLGRSGDSPEERAADAAEDMADELAQVRQILEKGGVIVA